MHQTRLSAPFLPLLFRQDGKEGAVGDNQQLQICDNLSGAARQLPWKGSLFRCGGGYFFII